MMTRKYILADATHPRLSDLVQVCSISLLTSGRLPTAAEPDPVELRKPNVGLTSEQFRPVQSHTWKDLVQTTVCVGRLPPAMAASRLQMQPPTSQQKRFSWLRRTVPDEVKALKALGRPTPAPRCLVQPSDQLAEIHSGADGRIRTATIGVESSLGLIQLPKISGAEDNTT